MSRRSAVNGFECGTVWFTLVAGRPGRAGAANCLELRHTAWRMEALLLSLSQLSYTRCLLPDSIIGMTVLLGIYLLVRARRQPIHLMIVGAGVCLGLSCWLRANVLVLAPFLCLFVPLLFPRDKWLRYAGLLVTAAVLTVMPITIRNALVFKSFIQLTLGTGRI